MQDMGRYRMETIGLRLLNDDDWTRNVRRPVSMMARNLFYIVRASRFDLGAELSSFIIEARAVIREIPVPIVNAWKSVECTMAGYDGENVCCYSCPARRPHFLALSRQWAGPWRWLLLYRASTGPFPLPFYLSICYLSLHLPSAFFVPSSSSHLLHHRRSCTSHSNHFFLPSPFVE